MEKKVVKHSCCCCWPVKKSQTIKLSAPSHRRVKFKFYFDWGQPLLCLMKQDMSKHPSCQLNSSSILRVFPRTVYVKNHFSFLDFPQDGSQRKKLQTCCLKSHPAAGPALSRSLSQWAAAGPVDLSLTHLRAASRLRGGGGVCVCVLLRQTEIHLMTMA